MASPAFPATDRAHTVAAATKRTAAAFAVTVGCVVVAGWLLDVRALKAGVLGSTVMNFNTALCFVLAGLSLLALGRARRGWRWFGLVCALLVALAGLLTFAEYAFGWPVGLNQLFVHPPPGESPLHYRMAPHAAFCVLLTGAALLLRHAGRGGRVAQALAFLLVLVAWLALVSYGYGVTYGTVRLPAMALFSALTFIALGVGLLCDRPAAGLVGLLAGDRLGSRLARRLLPAAVVIPAVLGWLRTLGERAGLYDSPFGAALMITSSVVILVAVIWRAAAGLNRADEMRRRAEDELRHSHDDLERRVRERTAELERQSAQLRASEQKLALAQEVGQIGTFDWDMRTGALVWTAQLEALFGLPPGGFGGTFEHWRTRVHPEDLPACEASIGEAIARKATEWRGVYRMTRADTGALRWIDAQSRIFYDARGEPLRMVGINLDVTERRQAEEALRFQAHLLDTVEQAVIATDTAGRITYWNSFAEKLYGWSAAEAVGRNIVEVTPTEESRAQSLDIMTRLAAGESWSGEFQVRRRDGTRFPAQVTDTPILDAGGQLVGIVGVSVDITERKRADAERNELLKRERAARAEAEEASRLKDEFLATVSHELRTPLTAILGWAQLLQSSSLDQQTTRRALETVERNAHAQMQLIEDLLDVSRIITGKLRLDVRPVELAPIMVAAADAARPAAEAKGIKLSTDSGEDAPVVLGDADRLQQVVWNLLSNAIKFTPQGGEVRLALARRDGQAEISVRDTGQGIAPEFLPHVFERFRQADQTPTRAHGGLGLGLAIVRHLVELHGGAVAATSAGEGQGATFAVQLPLAELRHADGGTRIDKSTPEQSAIRKPTSAILSGLRVLVVDDEQDARDLIQLALAQNGAQVTAADSAGAALAMLERTRPDLLVSDIGMPGADGYELIRQVREREAQLGLDRLPAVALTAYARPEDRAQALHAGYHTHIPKPVEPHALVAALARLTKGDEG